VAGQRKLGNWLEAYAEYTSESESPTSFHLWTGLYTLAGAMQRKIYIPTLYFNVHTNMYIILVSKAGKGKKTTAMNIGKHLLSDVEGIAFAADSTSVAAFVKQLSDLKDKPHQSLNSFTSELGTLLKQGDSDMVNFLTDIFDGNPDWHKQTIGRGKEKIAKPWLNVLAATTPNWLGDNLSLLAVGGGLMARTILVHEDQRILKRGLPEEDPRLIQLRSELVEDLAHIATLEGKFEFSPEAREFYEQWYLDESRFPSFNDERLAGYFDRKHIHVLKVAMAVSMSHKDALVLEPHDLQVALQILGAAEPGMYRAMASVGKNMQSTTTERVLGQIASAGPCGLAFKEILKTNIHDVDMADLTKILENLQAMGDIRVTTDHRFTAT
jgi:hypothetical protein